MGATDEGGRRRAGEHVAARERVAARDVAGAVVIVVVAALSQPLLDLLARNLAFFTAHRAESADVVLVVLVVGIAVPFALALPFAVVTRFLPRTGAVLAWAVVAVLVAAVVVRALEQGTDLPAGAALGVGAGTGAVVAGFCLGSAPVRTLLRWGLVLPAGVVAFFAVASPLSRLVLTPDVEAATRVDGIGDAVPVVVLLLDELPVQSLLAADGTIDESRYPGFARLAEDVTWYRNASTLYHNTSQIVPALLSGGHHRRHVEPSAAGYPRNLFSLLGERYDVWAHEEVTSLCTPDVCSRQPRPSTRERLRLLAADTAVVAAHVVVPEAVAADLPSVDGAWAGFTAPRDGTTEAAAAVEDAAFDDFLAALEDVADAAAPALRYFHFMAPHHPWRLLPDGVSYPVGSDVGIPVGQSRWWPDQRVVDQSHQRHLLQVGAVDRTVGLFLDTLEDAAWYDDALVVVAADHGIAFAADAPFRGATEANVDEIAYVPLFVKAPGQDVGGVDDRPATLLDILPTVVDVLDVADPPRLPGTSLLDPEPDLQRERTLDGFEEIALPPRRSLPDDVVAEKTRLFGSGAGWEPVWRPRAHAELVGRETAALAGPPAHATVTLVEPERYEAVDPGSGTVPALVDGEVAGEVPAGSWVAVALDGEVATVGPLRDGTGPRRFSALVPPSAFPHGDVDVTVHLVEETAEGVVLRALGPGP